MSLAAPESPPSPGPAKRRAWVPRGIWRRLALVFALLLLLGTGLRILLPALIERGTAFGSRYYLGLPVHVANADLWLIRGTIALEGITLGAAPDTATPSAAAWRPPLIEPSNTLLHVDRVQVSVSWRDLLKKTLRLTEVSIVAPSLRVLREADGKIDPLFHAKPLAPRSEPAAPSGSRPWAVEIARFALRSPNVQLEDEAGGQGLLEFSLEQFDLDNISLRDGQISLGTLGIHGPVLRVQRALVLSGASGGAAAGTPSPPAPPGPAAPPPAPGGGYRVKKIDVERAKFTWLSEDGPLDVNLTIRAADLTADEGKRFPIDVAVQIEGGEIQLAGEVGILPPAYAGTFTWDALPFPPLLLASRPELAAWLRSAKSGGAVKINADVAGRDGPPALTLSGHASLEGFAIADPGDKEISLAWDRLDVVMNDVFIPIPTGAGPVPATRADFASVKLAGPKIRYTHPPSALNALLPSSASGPAPAGPAPASPANPSPVELGIGVLEVGGGDIEVVDTTVAPATTSTIRNLTVSIRDLQFPDPSAAAISIRAMLPTAAELEVDGRLQPGNIGDYQISLQQFDLPAFSPYAKPAGASLDAGQASLKTNVKTRGATLQIDNDLVLRKFGISLSNPSVFTREFGIPIDLAIALLSDPAGDIRLTIPISINEKGTSVAAGTVIASALRTALLGAVSTPLKLLGATVGPKSGAGGGALAIAPIKSLPGTPDPAPDAPARADSLKKLLAQRPAMGLVLRGRTSAEDRPHIAEQILIERVQAGDGLPEVADAGFLVRRRITAILAKRGKGSDVALPAKDQPVFDRYIAAVTVPDDRLDALAASRADKVKALLVTKGIPASRISVGPREPAGESGVTISFAPPKK